VTALPDGLRAAPLSAADASAVTAVWAACEQHDDGRVEVTHEDIVGIFGRPSLETGRDTVALCDGDALVAFAIRLFSRLTFVHVLPSHRGRGIGTWLMRWSQDAARAAGSDVTGQALSEFEHAARALLESDGYVRRWEGWMFEIELDREPDPPVLPPGYTLRGFEPGRDERAAHAVVERAFGEWPQYEAKPFGDWEAEALRRPGFVPDLLGLVEHGGELVGAMLLVEDGDEGWVDQLAVAREHRGRGLARALLAQAFGLTWRRGGRRCGLGTDSRTGARGLYEHVGMRVRKTYGEYVKQL
jgi:mycothiol synthase